MFKTREGLSKQYEVSCAELDLLVDLVKNNPDVPGARMMGGGFGGCTINLVKETAVEELIFTIRDQYREKTGKSLNAYIAAVEEGTMLMEEYTKV